LVVVQPGETFAYTCALQVHHPRRFEAEIKLLLYDDVQLYDNGIRQVPLSVQGVGVAAEGTDHATDTPHP
jgi:hypothetical protein